MPVHIVKKGVAFLYFLGVDGGGSKTAFEVVDASGQILAKHRTGTCDYLQIGKQDFGTLIQNGAAEVCAKAGISVLDLTYTCVGVPNYGEISGDTAELDRIVNRALQNGHSVCVNDVVVAWAGSLACEPGINLLAGTGSMGYGVDRKGNAVRVGGWGDFCGDEGSAYWLGKKFIEYFTKQADGRMPRSKIYEIAHEKLRLQSDFDIIPLVNENMERKRDQIAKLQLLAFEAANLGDLYAVELYRQAAIDLSLIVSTVLNQLDFDRGDLVAVSYSGGVFKAGEYILEPFMETLAAYPITLKEPLLSPVSGAALYALFSSGCSIHKAVNRLREQELHNESDADT